MAPMEDAKDDEEEKKTEVGKDEKQDGSEPDQKATKAKRGRGRKG